MSEHRPPPKQRASSPANQRAIAAGQERRRLFLERFRETGDLDDACAAAAVSRSTYSAWRQRDPQWSAQIDAIRSAIDAEKQELVYVGWKGRFADFGREFFGRKYAWFHLLAAEAMEAAAGGDVVMFLWPPQHGKGLGLGTPIPTVDGWKTMGELVVGDVLFDERGDPCRVTHVSETHWRPCYRFTFADGVSVVCDDEHRWLTRTRCGGTNAKGPRYLASVREAAEIARTEVRHGRQNHAVPITAPIQAPEADLPLDPYLLGVWLGDGTTLEGSITTADPEILTAFELAGFGTRHRDRYTHGIYGLKVILRELGVLGNKHIPLAYLRASEKQRTALLQGLMDTDGGCSKRGQCDFANTRRPLIDGALELIRSLGFRVRCYESRAKLNGVDHGPYWRLSFYPKTDRPVFRLERKMCRQLPDDLPRDRDHWQILTAVEPVPTVPTRCIAVDSPSEMYLCTEGFIPTHNTSLAEDFINYKLAVDPSFRITVGTETGDLGEKMLQRIKMRMEADGPAKPYVRRFGPFTPSTGSSRKTTQPWASDHFNVWKKGQHDERDYSVQSLGMRSSVIGTRCDLMNIDDPQSRKTLGMTDFLLDVIRGDWLTRPGVEGHTVFNGSRQGEDDIYMAMQKAGIVDRLIKLPAYDEERTKTHGTPWLWPEQYSEADYLRLRRNAGEEAWERTYLQRDGLTLDATFTTQMLGPCHNPMRAVWHDPPADVQSIYISLDPSIGGPNGIAVVGATERRMYVLRCLSVRGLNSNQAILGEIEELCHQFHTDRHPVTDLVIEDKAFQKGMMDDTKLHELVSRFGFRVSGHNTGMNKYDENLGVPQMVHSFLREEIDLPYADNPSTRAETEELEKELKMWRPYVLGKKLRQDRVMALWFCWMLWRRRRKTLKDAQQGSAQWKHGGLPWKPTKSGLIVVGGR